MAVAGSDFSGEGLEIESPSKHLWTLLTGNTVLASFEVVHEELKRNCNRIITGLLSYKTLTCEDVEEYVKKHKQKETATAQEKLQLAVVQHLKLDEKDAFSLFRTYIVFEYKGSVVQYEKLMDSEKDLKTFLNSLEKFYMNERLCLIYCTQLLLKYAVHEDHPYTEIFSSFVQAACMEDWIKWMALSIHHTMNDEEKIEILHAISSILFYMGRSERVLSSAMKNLQNYDWTQKSKSVDIIQAEAVLCYCLLQAGDPTIDEHTSLIEKFLEQHVGDLLQNPYVLGVVLQSFKGMCGDNKNIKTKLQSALHPLKTASNIYKLVQAYATDSYKNVSKQKHGMSSVVVPSIHHAVKFLLNNYVRDNFGSNEDWYFVIESLLKDPEIVNEFVHDTCEEYLLIYSESLMAFPIFIETMLKLWTSIFSSISVPNLVTAEMLSQSIEELRWVAEIFDKIEPRVLRPNGNNEWILLQDRRVCNVTIRAGTIGTTLDHRHPLVLCWPVRLGSEIPVWKIILTDFVKPCIEAANHGNVYAIEHSESQLFALAEFLVVYSKIAQQISGEMLSLFKPLIHLLKRQASDKAQPEKKSRLIGVVLMLVSVGAKFDTTILTADMEELWPLGIEPNIVMKVIIGYESVTSSSYSVTKSFLKALSRLMDIPIKDGENSLRDICSTSIWFMVENIVPAYEHWRIASGAEKNLILNDCMKILLKLFRSSSNEYDDLKHRCATALMKKSSSLFAILRTDTDTLQDSIVRPRRDTFLLPDVLISSMTLLMEIHNFKKDILKTMDSPLALALIQKLGHLCRHRLSSEIPTLAIQFLKNVAAESTVSVLACLHMEAESFRDLILQRLELKSEDINMKVGILEFLGVCAHAQLGLVQHFFEESNFVDRLMELFQEKEENLSIALLGFIRALFRRGATTIKNYKGNIWEHIFDPIKRIRGESRLELVTRTMNIATFELYTNSGTDVHFVAEINAFLKKDRFENLLQICFASNDQDKSKARVALKQFIVVLTSRPDCLIAIPADCRSMMIQEFTNKIASFEEVDAELHSSGTIAELLLHLRPWESDFSFDDFVGKIAPYFDKYVVAMQKPLLALIVHSVKKSKSNVEPVTIEYITRIVSTIFFKSAQVYESDQPEIVHPILALGANIVTSIINSPHCLEWKSVFHSNFLVMSVVNVASAGIMKSKGPEIVAECLGVLIQLCTAETCHALSYTSFGKYLWLPLAKFATTDLKDTKWKNVYLLGLHLNARMISNLKFHYMEECLNFWGLHGLFLTHKLWDLAEIVDRFYLKTPEKNFREMKELLEIIVFTLDSVASMVPFTQLWRLEQPQRLTQVMEGLFTAMRTSIALLTQPNHLLFLISTSRNCAPQDLKLTPQMMEIQTKLWEVMGLGVEIFWKLRNYPHEYDFVEAGIFMTTIYTAVDLCVKGLAKGDKKNSLSVNVKGIVSITLEKSLGIIFFRGTELLKIIWQNPKDEKSMKREFEAETIAVCDNVKRLGLSGNEFLTSVCTSLEDMFK